MKKATVMMIALFAFVAFAAMPATSFACGEKAEKTNATQASSKSCGDKAEKANAKMASDKSCASKTDAKVASSKAACASKTDAKMASSKAACASKTDAKMASDKSCASKATADMANADGTCNSKYELVSMNISGMTCGGCESAIKTTLAKMDGVVSVKKVCYQSGTAMVYVDPAKMKDKSSMTTAVANKGFNAEIIPAVAKTTDGKVSKVDGKNCTPAEKAACAKMTAEQKAACAAACAAKKASTSEAKTVSAEGTN